MVDSDKDHVLQSIYYDVSDGYDTLNATYTRAKQAMASITFEYVKQYMFHPNLIINMR